MKPAARRGKVARQNQKQDPISFECRNGEQHITEAFEGAVQTLFGSDRQTINQALLVQCIGALADNERMDNSGDMRGFMVEIVREIAPRDGIERMLAVQMAATHVALVRSARRMANADHPLQFEANERAMTKMSRTFTAQMEALRKHRNGGKQTVTVQHVNVEDGGRAIVGNVKTGGGAKDET